MADSDKDILITPNVNQTSQPEIKLVGKDNSPMYLKVLDDNTLSFEGTEGQVFSIGPTMSSGDIFSVNDISGIQNMVVNADGTIKIIPTGTNPSSNLYVGDLRHCFVYARGTGNNNAANSLVYVNGKKIVDSATRGLNLTIINQVDLSVVSSTNYDTYSGATTNTNNLATAIGNMTDQQIGILVSEDAWEPNNTNGANLWAAAKLVGLTKLGNFDGGDGSVRRPYAAIFMGSGDDANAANKFVIERMSDADADAPMASISAILVSDGTHASIMGSNNVNAIWGADSNHEEPALIADEDNNIDILGGSGGNGQVNISRTSGATVFLQAQSATGIVGTSTNHNLDIKTNGSTRMRIESDGDVGIGTTSPAFKLDVNGYIATTTGFVHTGDTNNTITFGTDTQSFNTGSTARMNISDSGLQIGTGARVTTILDEDAMGSDSATALATQQSIKAYVDANAGGLSGGESVTYTHNSTPVLTLEQNSTSGSAVILSLKGVSNEILNVKNNGSIFFNLSTAGGSSTEAMITYRDTAGAERNALVAAAGTISLQNRGPNGDVDIRANNATAGSSGESIKAQFKHDRVIIKSKVYGDIVTVSSNTTLTQAQSGARVIWSGGTLTLPADPEVGTHYQVWNVLGLHAQLALGAGDSFLSSLDSGTNPTILNNGTIEFVYTGSNNWIWSK